jgi:hypothetical protein
MDETAIEAEAPVHEELSHDEVVERLRARQNFALAVPAGIAAAVVGAVGWALIVYVTHYETGLVAIAVGALVGYAVRVAGQGVDQKFGILGAVCAALGWALGTVLADVGMLAQARDMSFTEALGSLDLNGLMSLVTVAGDAMDLLFLAIAVYEGYRFAFRYKLRG